MRGFSVIMLPGDWLGDDVSIELARELAAIEGSLPLDVQHRVRHLGYAVQDVSLEMAERCLAAVASQGFGAVTVPAPHQPWQPPHVMMATRVAFEAEGLRHLRAIGSDHVNRTDLLFMHLATLPPPRPRETTALLTSSGGEGERAQGLRVDLHLREPRAVLQLDLHGTRYSFQGEGSSSFRFASPGRLLSALVTLSHGVLVLPDPRLLGARPRDPIWDLAVLPGESAMRARAAWFRQLAEHGLFDAEVQATLQQRLASSRVGTDALVAIENLDPPADPFGDQLDAVKRWLARGMKNRALNEAEKAVELRPDRPEGYRARASVHLAAGETEAADRDMAEADRLEAERSSPNP